MNGKGWVKMKQKQIEWDWLKQNGMKEDEMQCGENMIRWDKITHCEH